MYGQTMKTIRKRKGYTQKEVYAGVVSKSFYSDFEAEKYAISVEKFEGLLENLNLSFQEFHYFHQQQALTSYQQLRNDIDECYKRGKFEELYAVYQQHITSSEKTIRFLAAEAYLLVLITPGNFYRFSRDPFFEILAEVEASKMWTLTEIRLAKLLLLSMPEKQQEQAEILAEKIKQELKKYQKFDAAVYYEQLADFYVNRIQSLLVIHDISGAETELRAYEAAIQPSDHVLWLLQLRFIQLLVGLYQHHPAYEGQAQQFLQQMHKLPASECHFYQVIFELHNEKARSYYQRYRQAGTQPLDTL